MEAMRPKPRIPEWTVADRLRKARESAGISIVELSEMLDCSKQTIYNYEDNEWPRSRRWTMMRLWAWACDVDAGWIDPHLEGPPPWDRGPIKRKSSSACTNRGHFPHTALETFARPPLDRAA